MAFYKAGRVEEIPPGQTKMYVLAGTPVVLANWDGRFFALHGLCPHKLNPLEGARVWDYLLDCPWHHFQYDVRTGQNHYPNNVYPKDDPALQAQLKPLATYRVELRGQEIWVDLD